MVRRLLALFGLLCWLSCASANEAQPVASDPKLEARLQVLSEQLRCLVCQNQNLADSNAELAVDLKNQVRDMLKKGMSESQIVEFMVQRYGDFVLYKPPVKSTTWLLWGGPFILLIMGLLVLFGLLVKRRSQVVSELTEEERAAARRLLESENKGMV